MTRLTSTLLVCALLALTAACASSRGNLTTPVFTPLPPATLGAEISAYQQLHLQRDGDSHNLEIALDIRQQSLQMVVMTTLGRRLATLSYAQGQYHLKREPGAPDTIPYRQLLADIQMIFWPLVALSTADGDGDDGWHFEQHFEQQQQRSAWYDGRLIARISTRDSWSWTGAYQYHNQINGYQLSLQSVQLP
jgi:hypothetical protein